MLNLPLSARFEIHIDDRGTPLLYIRAFPHEPQAGEPAAAILWRTPQQARELAARLVAGAEEAERRERGQGLAREEARLPAQ